MAWTGTGKAGEGRMDIQAIAPDRAVVIGLEFIKPFPAKNTVEFTFVPGGGRQDHGHLVDVRARTLHVEIDAYRLQTWTNWWGAT
ncbi:MAG: hypothetical protein WDN06_05905 [Asticcacaulis sp.]